MQIFSHMVEFKSGDGRNKIELLTAATEGSPILNVLFCTESVDRIFVSLCIASSIRIWFINPVLQVRVCVSAKYLPYVLIFDSPRRCRVNDTHLCSYVVVITRVTSSMNSATFNAIKLRATFFFLRLLTGFLRQQTWFGKKRIYGPI